MVGQTMPIAFATMTRLSGRSPSIAVSISPSGRSDSSASAIAVSSNLPARANSPPRLRRDCRRPATPRRSHERPHSRARYSPLWRGYCSPFPQSPGGSSSSSMDQPLRACGEPPPMRWLAAVAGGDVEDLHGLLQCWRVHRRRRRAAPGCYSRTLKSRAGIARRAQDDQPVAALNQYIGHAFFDTQTL